MTDSNQDEIKVSNFKNMYPSNIVRKKIADSKIETFHNSQNEKLQSKVTLNYLENHLNKDLVKNKTKVYLITLNLDPTISFIKSWSIIQDVRELFSGLIIHEFEDCYFVATTIEICHDITKYVSKEEIKSISELLYDEQQTVENDSQLNVSYKSKTNPKSKTNIKTPEKKKKTKTTEISNDPNTEKNVYLQSSIENFYDALDAAKHKHQKVEPNRFQKLVKLHNFYTVAIYIQYATRRVPTDDQLINHLKECQKMYGKLIDRYTDNNGEDDFDETEKKILNYHQENGMCGCPHLHGTVALDPDKNENIESRLIEIATRLNLFKDIKVDRRIKNDNKHYQAIGYVLKNHSSRVVDSLLKIYGKSHNEIVQVDITNRSPIYEEHFRKMHEMTGINKVRENVCLCLYIYKTYVAEHAPPSEPIVDSEKNTTSKFLSYVIEHMKSSNIIIFENQVWQKKEGSRSSYDVISNSYMDYLKALTSNSEYFSLNIAILEKIERLMLNNTCLLQLQNQIKFPTKIINYELFEFKDFYLCATTNRIFLNQDKYSCYYFDPSIKFADIVEVIRKYIRVGLWLELFKRSDNFNITSLNLCYDTVRPKILKQCCLAFIGESNCGKTTTLNIFKKYYPQHKIGTLGSCLTEFHIGHVVKGKKHIDLNEFNELAGLGVPFIQLMDTRNITANEKFGDITTINTANTKFVATANIRRKDSYFNDKAITNRINAIFIKDGSQAKNAKAIVERQMEKESSLILLLCAIAYTTYGLIQDQEQTDVLYIPFVKKKMTEEDESFINYIQDNGFNTTIEVRDSIAVLSESEHILQKLESSITIPEDHIPIQLDSIIEIGTDDGWRKIAEYYKSKYIDRIDLCGDQ